MSMPTETESNQRFAQALALHQKGLLQEAARLYKLVLDANPAHADALHLLGVVAHQFGNHESAVTLISGALALQPRQGDYHYNLGSVYQALNRQQEAIAHYQICVEYQPANVKAWANLAVACQDANEWPLAMAANRRALEIDGDYPAALQNLGTLLLQSGSYAEAEKYFDRLLLRHPMLAETRSKKANIKLLRGDYRQGWLEQCWMYFSPDFVRNNPPRLIPFRKWNGAALTNGTLLVNCDLGVGDVVMYASCLPDLRQLARQVILECDARLVALLQRSFPAIKVIARSAERDFYWQQQLGGIDCRINISELPRWFRNSESSFPRQQGYLRIDEAKVQAWRARLQTLGAGLNIGISWRGGADQRSRAMRSIPLRHWQALAAISGLRLVNLQYGEHQAEIEEFNKGAPVPLHTFADLNLTQDLEQFAALVKALDLVISVDNTTIHIAGALNTPVWVLLPFVQDWRWLVGREDSPWYPSLRLFRANAVGEPAQIKQLQAVSKALQSALSESLFPRQDDLPGAAVDAADSSSWRGEGTMERSAQAGTAVLLNDTSAWYHWGCSCTSLAIHAQLQQKYASVISVPISDTRELHPCPLAFEHFDDEAFYAEFVAQNAALVQKIKGAAVVVVNGEGTLHGLSKGSLSLLYLMHIAKQRLQKKVCLINHSSYPDDGRRDSTAPAYALYKKIYAQLDFIAVREEASKLEFDNMNIAAVQSFDSLPLFIEQQYARTGKGQQQPYVVVAGSVAWGPGVIAGIGQLLARLQAAKITVKLLIGANAYMAADDIEFITMLAQQLNVESQLCLTTSEAEWLQVIEQASALVSGRFHHSIAAAFLATPFLVMGSNTPKIAGLLRMLELDAFVDDAEPDLAERLHERLTALIATPAAYTLRADIRASLLTLASKNYDAL